MDNEIIYTCKKCNKQYKNNGSLIRHEKKCIDLSHIYKTPINNPHTVPATPNKENNYDVNMTFLEDNKVEVEVKKQDDGDGDGDGEEILKEILKPKVSQSYQEEIDKLEELISMFKDLPIPENPENKDATIAQLKNIITIIMTQSKNLIKEMQQMSRRNSYFKNNIMLATFVLDKCRKGVPETDEEFDNMFT
jgi:hypothetical protein